MSAGRGPLVDVQIDCNGEAIAVAASPGSRRIRSTCGSASEVFAVIKSVSFDRGNTTRGCRCESMAERDSAHVC